MNRAATTLRRLVPSLFAAILLGLLGGCAEFAGTTATGGPRNIVPGSLPPPPAARPYDPGNYKVGKPYQIAGKWYYPKVDVTYEETGIASWYGPNFHGKKTANGEIFDMTLIGAAHRTLPMPSVVRVTNLGNGRSLIVRINDRGPFARGRIIDLSRRAAELLGFTQQGTAMVHVRLLADESRRAALEAGATGQDMAAFGPPPPKASPSVDVSIEPLSPVEGVAVAARPVSAAPVAAVSQSAPNATGGAQGVPPPFGAMTAIVDKKATSTVASVPAAPATQPLPETIDVASLPTREEVEEVKLDHAPSIFIQAGAFRQYVNANRLRARLTSLGHPVNVSQIYVTNQPFFRVRMGPLQSVEDADRALERVVALGYPEARIIVD
jgi:rare lipoprotein A